MRFSTRIVTTSLFATTLLFLVTFRTPGAVVETNAGFVASSAEDKAMGERALAAAQKAQGTPAQEGANFINGDEGVCYPVRILKGEQPATARELRWARREIADRLHLLEQGPTWPRPNTVRIPYATTKPKIDGKLDDPVWKSALTFRDLYPFNQTNRVDQPANACYVAWDEDYLYFAFACADNSIDAPLMKRDTDVFSHDCVEMYILPEFRLGMYWEIDVSPSGSIYDSLDAKRFTAWGSVLRPEENVAGLLTVCQVGNGKKLASVVIGDKGYAIEVAVPFKELPTYTRGNRPKPGDTLNFMLVRLDKKGDEFNCYAVVPLLSWGHNIWNYIPAVLAK